MSATQQEHAPYTLRWAFRLLCVEHINTEEEVLTAFRRQVKKAADGTGGYRGDMDELTKAKDYVLLALARSREQAIRDRVRELEAEERRKQMRRKEQQRRQDEHHQQPVETPPPKAPPPRQEQQAEEPRAPQAEHQEPERRAHQTKQSQEQTKPETNTRSTHDYGDTGSIQSALHLLEQRQAELTLIQQKERDLREMLDQTQAQGQALAQAVHTAMMLAQQIHTMLENVTREP